MRLIDELTSHADRNFIFIFVTELRNMKVED